MSTKRDSSVLMTPPCANAADDAAEAPVIQRVWKKTKQKCELVANTTPLRVGDCSVLLVKPEESLSPPVVVVVFCGKYSDAGHGETPTHPVTKEAVNASLESRGSLTVFIAMNPDASEFDPEWKGHKEADIEQDYLVRSPPCSCV